MNTNFMRRGGVRDAQAGIGNMLFPTKGANKKIKFNAKLFS